MVVGVVVTMGGEVVDSRAFGFARFELLALLFFGQFRAMCPVSRHLKHLPSVRYFARSSSVSFLKGRDVLIASTSIGTCSLFWLFDVTRWFDW